MNVLKGFGARIRIAREQAGLSQSQLAAKAGYTDRSSIAKLEKGQIDPSSSKITQIARALDVSEAWLLGWETDRMEDMVTVDGETARIAQEIFEDMDLRPRAPQARFDEIRLVQNQSHIRYISTNTTVFVSLLKHRYFAI